MISSFYPKSIYLLLFRRFREAGVSGRAASNCRVSFLRAGLSLLSGVLFLWDWYSFSEILLIKTFWTFLSAFVADFGAGLLSWVENDTLLFNLRGSVRLRWARSGFFCGVRMDFKGVVFLLMTLDTSEEVVDITETASESSSFINIEATSCASIRRPKNCPVDLRLSIRKSITLTFCATVHLPYIYIAFRFHEWLWGYPLLQNFKSTQVLKHFSSLKRIYIKKICIGIH